MIRLPCVGHPRPNGAVFGTKCYKICLGHAHGDSVWVWPSGCIVVVATTKIAQSGWTYYNLKEVLCKDLCVCCCHASTLLWPARLCNSRSLVTGPQPLSDWKCPIQTLDSKRDWAEVNSSLQQLALLKALRNCPGISAALSPYLKTCRNLCELMLQLPCKKVGNLLSPLANA